MIGLRDYKIDNLLHEGTRTTVCRAFRESDGEPVIIKSTRGNYPRPRDLARIRREYELLSELQSDTGLEGISRALALESADNSLALVLQDIGGNPLNYYIEKEPLDIDEFLEIAVRLAGILAEVHEAGIIHKDIKPRNIIYNRETGVIRIADFGLASQLTQESASSVISDRMEGSLPYMSPEQTGRMNRAVDYRSDLYSLGATFYELLTGRPPFIGANTMELVHCHIARVPESPGLLRGDIPDPLSDIILKLLAKRAEERYRNAFGLKHDLEVCREQWKKTGGIAPFELGSRDISDRFQIPQKLYGRDREIETLMNAFSRAAQGGGEFMLVAGYSGIGKTALVNEVQIPITEKRGYFISGKFDQFKRDIPYTALIQAFQDMVRQLLTEDAERIAIWKERMLEALRTNGQVIVDVLPELELIIGPQPEIPELPPMEAQNRFSAVFTDIVHSLCAFEHPLVLFLDDLQWADTASLKLLRMLMRNPGTAHLLLIGAYRDNEVGQDHHLVEMVDDLKSAGLALHEVKLQPLAKEHVRRLIAESLNRPENEVGGITDTAFEKTEGNPFFLNEFLKGLVQEGSIRFHSGAWVWDEEGILHGGLTDNVVEFLTARIRKLPEASQDLLKTAAVIGNRFDLGILSVVHESSGELPVGELWEALRAGLIVPLDDSYKFASRTPNDNEDSEKIGYRFLHDRVQQAAYSLIGEDERRKLHLVIGRHLSESLPPERMDEHVIDIANHMNLGADPDASRDERMSLIHLNLRAGSRARLAAAYDSALNYLTRALELLPGDAWTGEDYELTRDAHTQAAEMLYLNGEHEEADRIADIVLERSREVLDKVPIYVMRSQLFTANNRMEEVVDMTVEILRLMGYKLPDNPGNLNIIGGLLGSKAMLFGKSHEDLLAIPEMDDATTLAAMKLTNMSLAAAYLAGSMYLPLLIFLMVKLTIKKGNCDTSPVAWVMYGLLLSGPVGDINGGYGFGHLALKLADRYGARTFRARVIFIFNSFVRHWKEDARNTFPDFQEASRLNYESGDLMTSSYALMYRFAYSFLMDAPLQSLHREFEGIAARISGMKQDQALMMVSVWGQLVENLLGQADDFTRLVGVHLNEDETIPIMKELKQINVVCHIYFGRMLLLFLSGRYEEALKAHAELEPFAEAVASELCMPRITLFAALAESRAIGDDGSRRAIPRKLRQGLKKLKRWAGLSPVNQQAAYLLLRAEEKRLRADYAEAIELYDAAAALARENEQLLIEAMANEFAAAHYQTMGKDKIALTYLTEARYQYHRWGSDRVLAELDKRFPGLRPSYTGRLEESLSASMSLTNSTDTYFGTGSFLDMTTFTRAARTLSGELVLSNLLRTMLELVMENAGAERGLLLLNRDEHLFVEAEARIGGEEIDVMQNLPAEEAELPLSLLVYAMRTGESIALADAAGEGEFKHDPYIRSRTARSIVCHPIIHRGKTTGLLYLENNLATGVFTPARRELLSILTVQAAVSLENAILYSDMEKKVQERTLALEQAQKRLLQLERETTERRMAGGFAHEMRNALAGSKLVLDKALGMVGAEPYVSIPLRNARRLKEVHEHVKDHLDQERTDFLMGKFRAIFKDEIELEEILKVVRVSMVRGLRITSRIMSYSQIGEDSEVSIEMDLTEVIRAAVQRSIEGYPLHARLNGPLEFKARADHFDSILDNLYLNAVDAVKERQSRESITPNISIALTRNDDECIIEFQDNGIGIAAENREKIFEPFYSTKPDTGTGLGLGEVNKTLALYGGRISIESERGVGTKFIIRLPLTGDARPAGTAAAGGENAI